MWKNRKRADLVLHLFLAVRDELLPRFCTLASGGLTIRVRTGGSVQELLCEQLGLSADYLEKRIQTIFLDNAMVDDPRQAVVLPNATLALSAAMPGIAGAMLRRGSPYAAMRSQISHVGNSTDPTVQQEKRCEGTIVIKLFNLLRDELAPTLLARGVEIDREILAALLRRNAAVLTKGIVAARLDDALKTPEELLAIDWSGTGVFLQVVS